MRARFYSQQVAGFDHHLRLRQFIGGLAIGAAATVVLAVLVSALS